MFTIKQWQEQHCILHTAQEVPQMIRAAIEKIGCDKLEHRIWDIDSCYPSMPKADIIEAMEHILHNVRNQTRKCKRKFILVPRCKNEKPIWGTSYTEDQKKTHIKINFQVMIDLIRFSMDNAICKLGGECFIRQTTGIPQGDSLSPAMCIGTCGWYEMRWMQKWNPEDRKLFQIRRYLDDVNMMFKTNSPRAKTILEDFQEKGSCYPEDLSLEGEEDNSEYLETNIIYGDDGAIACKHRNKNEGCENQQVFYKGKHAMSFSSNEHKMGAMIGTCYRIQRNSFTDELMIKELKEKVREWQECLGHKPKFIESAVKYLANKHSMESAWPLAYKKLFVDTLS